MSLKKNEYQQMWCMNDGSAIVGMWPQPVCGGPTQSYVPVSNG
ncbi:hypothetical Protein YC6258_04855 [Gynuella sunshinyii YC6258]|uniref:Uncharacterized protein n=1 Tax=Gynuella sunshinyii YC6258 TaxID=1445510 RepID=A0A0C5VQL6_9GAMM|nr:hypothetical Protein YC6258_04855 [Gynuella sunshinyii YC6258]